MKDISIVIPVYNDQEVLSKLYQRLAPVVLKISINYEIIFVDDGSQDESCRVLQEIQFNDHRIRIIRLSQNFGQANAIAAGLEESRGEFIVIMDCDLSDRPEDIPAMLKKLFMENVDMVIARRSNRHDAKFNKFLSKMFFILSNKFTQIKHQENLGVFRIIKRSCYQKVISRSSLSGTILSRFYQAGVAYETIDLPWEAREAGKSGYTLKKKIKLALDRILPNLKYSRLRQQRDPYFVVKEIIDIRETK